MKNFKHLVIALVLVGSAVLAQPARGECTRQADNVFECTPAGTVSVGAVFSASESGARRDVSLALVSDLLEEEAEEIGKGSGDRRPIQAFGTLLYGDKDYATVSVPGFDSDTWGGIAGVSLWGANYFAGIALDYSEEDATYKDNAGKQDTDALGVQLFGTYYPLRNKNLYLSAAFRYGSSDIATERTFITSNAVDNNNRNVPTTAHGSTNGSATSLLGGAGYSWLIQPKTLIGLTGWLSWADNAIDGYTESGSIAQGNEFNPATGNLRFGDDNYSTFNGILTANILHAIPISNGRVSPGLSVSYVHEFESDTRTIDATLVDVADATNNQISYATNPSDPNYFLVGASLTAELNQGTTLYATVTATVGHDWRNENVFAVGLNQAF